jgi:hypothetical protein
LKSKILAIIIISTLVLSSYAIIGFFLPKKSASVDLYVGITADGNVITTKKLIDKVKDFANMLIIMQPEIVKNISSLTEVCNYANEAEMAFFVHMGHPSYWKYNHDPLEWINHAKKQYGAHFLGVYLYDEPGGNQLDLGPFREFDETTMPYDYRDATNTYVYYLYVQMRDFIKTSRLITSDYGLFWFDYEAGYDVILGEFIREVNKNITIPLCRGAAELHNKTWGVMITHAQESPPYIQPPEMLYNDLIDAYQAGAKYIAVFNFPQINQYWLLTEEHFDAIRNFTNYVAVNSRNETSNTERVAYVLPENYGWGMRDSTDKIWGVWEADEKSPIIWKSLNEMITKYGYDFDIVYDSLWTKIFARQHYNTLIYWNGTIRQLN